MPFLTEKKFDFVSTGLDPDTFGVVRFKGSEGFSRCYEFEVDLVSTEAEIDLDQVLKNPATFTILREEGDIPFHGILAEFEQLHMVDEYVFYRAVLVPKLWWLSLTHHNQVFLDKKIPDILQEVLKDGGLTSLDFDLKLQKTYPKWEYVCQYRESHLEFVSRWMEREGMYTYFEQGDDREKVIVTDTRTAHQEMPQGKTMYYSPPSGLDEFHREEVIKSFVCRQRMLPKTLKLKDYNYRTPSLDVSGSARVKSDGRGEVYIYGEHFRTPEEGNALAKIRAEEWLCQEKRFYGESTIPYLRPGYLFDLQDHYRSNFNQRYLTIELNHEGSQAAYLLAGIQKGLSEVEEQPYYRNGFVATPGDVQFRPERKTEKARFYGTMNAKIDAAGSGKYAELDDEGRYKVLLPFDLSGRKDGKGSTWLRMAQPYAGSDHGMNFPLHKGTEVLLTFIDGDPDRPIVQGAVPNPETASQVTSSDQSMSKITTAGGNKIHMEDEEGNQRILMHSPTQNSFVRIGAPNDPDEPPEMEKELWGIAKSTGGILHVKAAAKNEIILGESTETVVGLDMSNKMVAVIDTVLGMETGLKVGGSVEFTPLHHGFREQTVRVGAAVVRVHGDGVKVTGNVTDVHGNQTSVTGNADDVTGSHTRVKGNATTVSGDNTTVKGNATNVTGNDATVQGDGTTVSGANTRVTGPNTAVSGQTDAVQGDNTTVSGNVTNVTGPHTTISGTADNITSAHIDVTATVKTII
jgi:type VI secretion system secreted protein VgrG